jgi:protein subunit release factor A
MAKQVSGRRVYVTFIKDGTIAIHPSNCRSDRYRMRGKGSIHVSKNTSAAELGRSVLKVRDVCLT